MPIQTTYIKDHEFRAQFSIVEENDEPVRFDTFKELTNANIANPATIWTAIEAEDNLYFESGIRRVNVVYYFLTNESVEKGVSYVVDCDCNNKELWV